MTTATQHLGEAQRYERARWRDLLFSFRGRISRRTYVTRVLLAQVLLASAAVLAVALLIFLADARAQIWLLRGIMLFGVGVAIATIWANAATLVKRLHDRNRNGWLMLLALVPLVNLWIYFEGCVLAREE